MVEKYSAYDSGPEVTDAWIASAEMDRTTAYVIRGRAFREQSDTDLLSQWKAAFEAFAEDLGCRSKAMAESDLKSEVLLRGLVPPFGEVQDALNLLSLTFESAMAKLAAERPDELRRLETGLMQMVDRFQQDPNRGQN